MTGPNDTDLPILLFLLYKGAIALYVLQTYFTSQYIE